MSDIITLHKNKFGVKNSDRIIYGIDLFCGVGGLTHGLIEGGIRVIAGVDLDPQCRFPYETNNHSLFIERDIRKLSGTELSKLFGNAKLRLLAGCAPCQPFSTYSQKNRQIRDDKSQIRDDKQWDLVADFGRLVREIQPEFVTMENVPQLLEHQVFQNFLEDLKGYEIWYKIIQCADYGVPQTRKRLVLIASRLGLIELLPPHESTHDYATGHATVRQAIFNLPKLEAGGSDPKDPIHTASSLSELNLRRIKASHPGGTWRDWDESLRAPCHRRNSGQTYPSVYGRMEWDAPAPTITTQCFGYGNGRFGHPEQNRAISLREAAILQTFPENYRFLEPGEKARFHKLGRLIGNAVPVRIGKVVAQSFLSSVEYK
ncbi:MULTISPECIES: DNA cytosine methyltransferase [Spirulina sp. CCY15215]|uniref:DNA cytosine methyltransferase n=1 Tax=Spirulina sp. CCY15215 TaxID=2767591 RepID=UPI001951045B